MIERLPLAPKLRLTSVVGSTSRSTRTMWTNDRADHPSKTQRKGRHGTNLRRGQCLGGRNHPRRNHEVLCYYFVLFLRHQGGGALGQYGQDLRTITSFIVACEACISVRTLAVWWNFNVLSFAVGRNARLSGTERAVGRIECDLHLKLRRHCAPCPDKARNKARLKVPE